MLDTFLTTEDLAEKLHVPVETVRHWRTVGTGPLSIKLGHKILYPLSDVEAWINSKRAASAARLDGKAALPS